VPDERMIRAKVKCCACGGSLLDSARINVVCLMKEAEWLWPCWGNVLLGVLGFASAILSDKCLRERKRPKFALEWNQDLSIVKYHPVAELRDVPKEVFKPLDLLEPGRHGVGG